MSDWTASIASAVGALAATVDDGGRLVALHFPGERAPAITASANHSRFAAVVRELDEYFAGARRDFTLELAPRGTEFQHRVWTELQRIPYGGTISYRELAVRIGQPTATRAVARANAANPIAIIVPCHRVIGADGSLTGFGGGLERKRLLPYLEGARPPLVAS